VAENRDVTITPVHHVANGSATMGLIAAAGLPGTTSLWADPLHEGPVPGGIDDEALTALRAAYLAGSDARTAVDPANDLRRWREAIVQRAADHELVLWFEHDLFDQLNLVHWLSWMHERLGSDRHVSAVDVTPFTARADFKGIGQLAADDVAALFASRRPVGEAAITLAAAAWTAFRAPTPTALDALRHGDTSALPFLGAALHRFLQEYPWTDDGLSRTERRLLQLADPGPVPLAGLFPRMHDGERAYYVTDLSLAALTRDLADADPPLLALAPDAPADAAALAAAVSITDAGRDALAGRRDRVQACGLDRWLGGVHLHCRRAAWRWDDRRSAVVRG
jgi:hypothetical protein